MKTVCIETDPSAAIGWGVRYYDENALYTTLQSTCLDPIRDCNLMRFKKEVKKLTDNDLKMVLEEDNNIQIISNNGTSWILWLYNNLENHTILSKSWIVDSFRSHKLETYLPKSIIIAKDEVTIDKLCSEIEKKFCIWEKIVIKHAGIDGNWNGVGMTTYTDNKLQLRIAIQNIVEKFLHHFKWDIKQTFWDSYLIQEHISDIIWEWSITFSIQNKMIENRWLSNNIVSGGEYFWSTNVFSYLNKEQEEIITETIYRDFSPLLIQLQDDGIRWNVWFDILFQEQEWSIKTFILECNWIHRMTWSMVPKNFAYNTENNVSVWLPIAQKYLNEKYQDLSNNSLLKLANNLESFWTNFWEDQIMNIKYEWAERWHPVLWIAAAWSYQKQLFQLFHDAKITNNLGTDYIRQIFEKMG